MRLYDYAASGNCFKVRLLLALLGALPAEITVLFVEHDLDLVLALADRAYVLDRGRVTHEGPAEPLLRDLELRRRVLWL